MALSYSIIRIRDISSVLKFLQLRPLSVNTSKVEVVRRLANPIYNESGFPKYTKFLPVWQAFPALTIALQYCIPAGCESKFAIPLHQERRSPARSVKALCRG